MNECKTIINHCSTVSGLTNASISPICSVKNLSVLPASATDRETHNRLVYIKAGLLSLHDTDDDDAIQWLERHLATAAFAK